MFNEITEVERSKIYFECSRCGHCCRYRGDLTIMPMDLFRYCRFFNMSTIEFLEKYARIEQSSSNLFDVYIKNKEDAMNTCIFFDDDNGCSINSIKPAVCYFYPFFVHLFNNEKTSVQMTDCVMNCLQNSANKSEERIIDLIEKASSNRYHSEKEVIKKYINLISNISIALKIRLNSDSEKKKYIEKFFEDFYIKLDLSDEHYIENKIEEWSDIIIFI